jgi:hypothetical protein
MAKKTCPTCGCIIASSGYETGGVVFCCEPCATNEPCGCGCCDEGTKTDKKPIGKKV